MPSWHQPNAARCSSRLARYRAEVPDHYDEPLREVAERIDQTGSLGKSDIGALYLWKRIPRGPWCLELLRMPKAKVRAITSATVQAARLIEMPVPEAAAAARSTLYPLPGTKTGDALPSALILASAPKRMAVYDIRAHKGLARVCLPLRNGHGRYRRYMELVETCRAELLAHGAGVHTARQVDLALYWLGGHPAHPGPR
ncbi:hypothetical protein GA0074704_4059 [Micromonospora siamensis]|uniref:Uncharacterized protein n=1 Tax=Micromonospora siamensis TaxID=299152 RepID=A0A1C5J2R6_9ACTN|nr:hypothetical protein GA0074704_4059 [Micromonospora siamensis]